MNEKKLIYELSKHGFVRFEESTDSIYNEIELLTEYTTLNELKEIGELAIDSNYDIYSIDCCKFEYTKLVRVKILRKELIDRIEKRKGDNDE